MVTLFSAVLLLYANSFVMKRRRRELGLYNILGLEKRHTARLMVWETLYCAAAAIVGGLAAGVLLSKLVLLLLLQLSHLPVEYGFEISLSGMADTAALFGFLFLLTLVWNLFGCSGPVLWNCSTAPVPGSGSPGPAACWWCWGPSLWGLAMPPL